MTVDVSYCDSRTVDRCHNSELVLSEQIRRFGGTTSELRSGDRGHRLGLERLDRAENSSHPPTEHRITHLCGLQIVK